VHRVVIFAIAQFSCYLKNIIIIMLGKGITEKYWCDAAKWTWYHEL